MRSARLRTLMLTAAVVCAAVALEAATRAADAGVRGPRIPGTALRLGDSLSIVRGHPDVRAVSDPDLEPGEMAYGGTLRFYGAPGDAKLVFQGGALARATIVLKRPSPRTRAYVEDDLRRLGYRAECRRTSVNDRDCDWTGPLSATVRADTAQMSADFGALGIERTTVAPGVPDVGAMARSLEVVLAADSTPVLPDTLELGEDNPNGYPRPFLTKSALARIPDDIRATVTRGTITVLAFVGADGRVLYVEAIDGSEELRPIAAEAVMQYRFQRYAIKEGRRRFWVRVSIYPA